MINLHKSLRLIRIFHDVNQNQLAEKCGISKSYLSEIESGKKPISIELLEKYSKIFHIPVSSLILFSEELNSNKFSEKNRVFAVRKIVKIMEWLVAKGFDDDKTL